MKQLDRHIYFGNFKKDVIKKFGKPEGSKIWAKADAYTKQYLNIHKNAAKDALVVAYPMAGIYRALQERIPKEEALAMLMAYAPSAGEKARDKMAKITSFPGLPWLIWKNRVAIMKSAGSAQKGYTSEIVDVSKESVTMYIYRCPIHEALKELEMPEIAPVMCVIDQISTSGIRGVCYHRTMSVAEGDAYCDYYITRT